MDANKPIGAAVWVEKTGKVFAYAQYTAHSSEFQDFWQYDITSQTNLESWGVQIRHTGGPHTASGRAYSKMNEVEIFYGQREGISQPRFGGMWWESNPLLVALFWFGVWVNSILMGLAAGFWAIFGPGITALQNAIGGWFIGLQAAIGGWFASVSADVGAWFVNNFLPAVGVFIQAFIATFFAVILTPVVGLLALISLFLTGDPYLLPVATANFFVLLVNVFSWIGTAFAGLVTFFAMLAAVATGHPIAISGTAGTVIDLINRVLYYIVTFGPLAILLHVMISVLACLPQGRSGDFTIEPLINCGLFYYHILDTVATVFFRVFSFLANIIISIMELIPF